MMILCSDLHHNSHLELKPLKLSVPTLTGCVMAQRCNNCIAGDHTLHALQPVNIGG